MLPNIALPLCTPSMAEGDHTQIASQERCDSPPEAAMDGASRARLPQLLQESEQFVVGGGLCGSRGGSLEEANDSPSIAHHPRPFAAQIPTDLLRIVDHWNASCSGMWENWASGGHVVPGADAVDARRPL